MKKIIQVTMKSKLRIVIIQFLGIGNLVAQDSIKKVTIKDVLINAKMDKHFTDSSSTAGTRLPLKLIETPQSIQVITHDLIQDQQAQNLNDVVKNMVGVINNNNFSSFTMRGFSSLESSGSNNFITFDGILGNMYYWQQLLPLYNIDRVENIGGPAAALYSVGTPGGVMNMVTKKPLDEFFMAANVTTGSWGLIDGAIDVGGPLSKNKKWLYRLNLGYNHQDSYRAYQFTQNAMFAPSIAYKPNASTELNLDAVITAYNTRVFEDDGGAILMNKDSTFNWKGVNKNAIFYSPTDYGNAQNNAVTLSLKHKFTDHFKLNFVSRGTYSTLYSGQHTGNYYNTGPNTNDFMAYPDSIQRLYTVWNNQSYNIINSLYTTETFGSSNFKNTLVTGIDYQILGSKDDYIQGMANSVSWNNPNYNQDAFSNYPLSAATTIEHASQQTTQFAVYAQDLIAVGTKLKVLIAGRYETFNWMLKPTSNSNTWPTSNDTSKAKVFVPRAGIVYTFMPHQSVYSSYCESFSPQYDNSPGTGGPFPPQIGQQVEVGEKGEYLNGKLMTTISAYNILWNNILAPAPTIANPYLQKAIPGLTSQGVELSAAGNIKQFALIGSYAYNQIVFASNSPLGTKGQSYDNAPHHIANLWVKYAFKNSSALNGLSVSVGGRLVSERIGSTLLAPKYEIPGYFILDAAVNYSYKRYNFSFNGYNLLNESYITGWYASDFMAKLGTPINWKLSVRYSIR